MNESEEELSIRKSYKIQFQDGRKTDYLFKEVVEYYQELLPSLNKIKDYISRCIKSRKIVGSPNNLIMKEIEKENIKKDKDVLEWILQTEQFMVNEISLNQNAPSINNIKREKENYAD